MDYWIAELDDYILSKADTEFSVRQIAEYLGISVTRLCQHVLYVYGYPLEARIAFLKNPSDRATRHIYTPLECWIYREIKPGQHYPMNIWLSNMPYDKIQMKGVRAAGFRIPYKDLERMEESGLAMPGSEKKEWVTTGDYVTGGTSIGAWLFDEETGETSYFYGKTRSDVNAHHPYKETLNIPCGLYAAFPVELWSDDNTSGRARRAYGGFMVRETVCRDLQKANPYVEYDESRFCFETYNGKKELSLFIPIQYPPGYAPERMFWYHLQL